MQWLSRLLGMNSNPKPLALNDTGPFGELSKRPNPDGLVVVTYPLFELILPILEQQAGRKFTPRETEIERSRAIAVALNAQEAQMYIDGCMGKKDSPNS